MDWVSLIIGLILGFVIGSLALKAHYGDMLANQIKEAIRSALIETRKGEGVIFSVHVGRMDDDDGGDSDEPDDMPLKSKGLMGPWRGNN